MNGNTIRTFLGANSSEGFASLYKEFLGNYRTIVIKGGPGSGKSGFMKKVAAKAVQQGYFTEYCYCSSDASSLDAIRIPEKNLCIVDGTLPHCIEPRFPGAQDEILYTGQFWDPEKLKSHKGEIVEFSEQIRSCFDRTYRYLSAAGKAAEDMRKSVRKKTDRAKMRKFAADMIRRKGKRTGKQGEIYPRFLSGITPQGLIVNRDTIYTLAETVYVLDDPYRMGGEFLEAAIEAATDFGYDIYVFYDPLSPSVPEHLAVPALGIGFATKNKIHSFEPQNAYRIHLSRFGEIDGEIKEQAHKGEELISLCLKEALRTLKKEKAYHDDLEEYYVEAMDFKKMNGFSTGFIHKLFS